MSYKAGIWNNCLPGADREHSVKRLLHPPLSQLVLSVLVLGGKVTSYSQIPTSAQLWRLKSPGVAGAQVPPSLISGDPKREGGSQDSAEDAFTAVLLYTCLIGQVQDQAWGTPVHLAFTYTHRTSVSYSSEARTVIPDAPVTSEVNPTRGK